MRRLKIFFSCSGVGILDRGIEVFFREAFDGLRGSDGLDIALYKGAGDQKPDEHILGNLPRTSRAAELLGKLVRRSSYTVEQLSTFPSMVHAVRKHRPDIIFYSDANLGFQLFRWRKQIGVPYRLLFSNGGPCHPPFDRTDYVHQVTPFYYDEAIAAGESPRRHRVVPYGIDVPRGAPDTDVNLRNDLRRKIGLPVDRPVVLSVGLISAQQKRMDYLVKEIAQLCNFGSLSSGGLAVSPYLVMLGAIDESSNEIISLANGKLGECNFTVRSVPHDEVAEYYSAADLFVLASLQEGFGRVFLEALIYGLPVIAHDHPVMRFVLGEHGVFADLSRKGALVGLIHEFVTRNLSVGGSDDRSQEAANRRREYVRARFSWLVLRSQYREMFFDCANATIW